MCCFLRDIVCVVCATLGWQNVCPICEKTMQVFVAIAGFSVDHIVLCWFWELSFVIEAFVIKLINTYMFSSHFL